MNIVVKHEMKWLQRYEKTSSCAPLRVWHVDILATIVVYVGNKIGHFKKITVGMKAGAWSSWESEERFKKELLKNFTVLSDYNSKEMPINWDVISIRYEDNTDEFLEWLNLDLKDIFKLPVTMKTPNLKMN